MFAGHVQHVCLLGNDVCAVDASLNVTVFSSDNADAVASVHLEGMAGGVQSAAASHAMVCFATLCV